MNLHERRIRNVGHHPHRAVLRVTVRAAALGAAVTMSGAVWLAGPAGPAGAAMVPAQIVLPFTGLEGPVGVAVDAAGDVYVAEEDANTVLELPAGATSSSQVLTLPFGDSAPLSEPFGVAVDAAGDVYVTNEGSGQLVELPAACEHQLDCAVNIPLKGQGDQGLGNPLGTAELTGEGVRREPKIR